jgi:hypothetical protein
LFEVGLPPFEIASRRFFCDAAFSTRLIKFQKSKHYFLSPKNAAVLRKLFNKIKNNEQLKQLHDHVEHLLSSL